MQSDNVRIHEIPQSSPVKWSLYSLLSPLPHFIVDIWKMGSGGWEKELSVKGYNLISLLALSGKGLSLGAQIGV